MVQDEILVVQNHVSSAVEVTQSIFNTLGRVPEAGNYFSCIDSRFVLCKHISLKASMTFIHKSVCKKIWFMIGRRK